MRAIAKLALSKVAVSAQDLITGWVTLAFQFGVQHWPHKAELAVRCAVIGYMVKLEEFHDGLATTRAYRATISCESFLLKLCCLSTATVYATLALLVAWRGEVSTALTQAGLGVLLCLLAAFLLACRAPGFIARGWRSARLAEATSDALNVRGPLPTDTGGALQTPRITRAATVCTQAKCFIALAARFLYGVAFFFGSVGHGSNLHQKYTISATVAQVW